MADKKTSLIVRMTDGADGVKSKSILNVNPDASLDELKTLAQGLVSLTDRNYVGSTRIEQTDTTYVEPEKPGKPVVLPTVIRGGTNFNSGVARGVFIKNVPNPGSQNVVCSGKKPKGATILPMSAGGEGEWNIFFKTSETFDTSVGNDQSGTCHVSVLDTEGKEEVFSFDIEFLGFASGELVNI